MTFFKGIFKHCLRFQVIQSMVWRTGETEKLQTEVISGRNCWEMFARNKEEFYGGGPDSCLTTTQTTVNSSVKSSSHLLGHFPLMMRPLHPQHSETHLAALYLEMCCLAGTGKAAFQSASEKTLPPSVWGGLPSRWSAARSERFTGPEG